MPYKPQLKICQYCKKEFWARRPESKFCCHSCVSKKINSYQYLKKYREGNTYILPKLKRTEWNYIAGFIDGEGTICISGKSPLIGIYNSNVEVMRWLKTKLNFQTLYKIKREGRKIEYSIRLSQKEGITKLLIKLMPYLKIKKQTAKDMIMRLKKESGQQ